MREKVESCFLGDFERFLGRAFGVSLEWVLGLSGNFPPPFPPFPSPLPSSLLPFVSSSILIISSVLIFPNFTLGNTSSSPFLIIFRNLPISLAISDKKVWGMYFILLFETTKLSLRTGFKGTFNGTFSCSA